MRLLAQAMPASRPRLEDDSSAGVFAETSMVLHGSRIFCIWVSAHRTVETSATEEHWPPSCENKTELQHPGTRIRIRNAPLP